jgi:hypothetical protein
MLVSFNLLFLVDGFKDGRDYASLVLPITIFLPYKADCFTHSFWCRADEQGRGEMKDVIVNTIRSVLNNLTPLWLIPPLVPIITFPLSASSLLLFSSWTCSAAKQVNS